MKGFAPEVLTPWGARPGRCVFSPSWAAQGAAREGGAGGARGNTGDPSPTGFNSRPTCASLAGHTWGGGYHDLPPRGGHRVRIPGPPMHFLLNLGDRNLFGGLLDWVESKGGARIHGSRWVGGRGSPTRPGPPGIGASRGSPRGIALLLGRPGSPALWVPSSPLQPPGPSLLVPGSAGGWLRLHPPRESGAHVGPRGVPLAPPAARYGPEGLR